MAEPVKRTPRAYNSQRRQEAARQTRERILEAARGLFVERGFAGTTIAAIAAEAGTAAETVYAAFGTKIAVLAALVRGAARGADDREILEQEGARAVAAATDQREQLRLFARDIAGRLARAAPLLVVVASASVSEPALAELYGSLHAARLRNLRALAGQLAGNGPLRVDENAATDTIWALTAPELYHVLTTQRGWTRERYAAWLEDTLASTLLVEQARP
jgi:AcrR family transcriptional regulator